MLLTTSVFRHCNFVDIIRRGADGRAELDVERIHDVRSLAPYQMVETQDMTT